MKTLLFLFSFLIVFEMSTLAGNPYLQRDNAIYVVVQPGDLGFGLRYDRYLSKNLFTENYNKYFDGGGVYCSFTKGSYRLPFGGYIKDHYRCALGYMYGFPQKFNNPFIKDYLSLGVTYHSYGGRFYADGLINEKVFKPWSFEAGVGVNIKRFILGIRMDILKWEGSVDWGFTF